MSSDLAGEHAPLLLVNMQDLVLDDAFEACGYEADVESIASSVANEQVAALDQAGVLPFPPNIRTAIYHLLVSKEHLVWLPTVPDGQRQPKATRKGLIALLGASKATRNVVSRLLSAHGSFFFFIDLAAKEYTKAPPVSLVNLMQDVRLDIVSSKHLCEGESHHLGTTPCHWSPLDLFQNPLFIRKTLRLRFLMPDADSAAFVLLCSPFITAARNIKGFERISIELYTYWAGRTLEHKASYASPCGKSLVGYIARDQCDEMLGNLHSKLRNSLGDATKGEYGGGSTPFYVRFMMFHPGDHLTRDVEMEAKSMRHGVELPTKVIKRKAKSDSLRLKAQMDES